ncbi:hypothetical protein D3C71_1902970 [compost metagenome]
MQQHRLYEHSTSGCKSSTVQSEKRDEAEVECDVDHQRAGVEDHAQRLLAGHRQQRFGRADESLGEDTREKHHHQRQPGDEGRAEERKQERPCQ